METKLVRKLVIGSVQLGKTNKIIEDCNTFHNNGYIVLVLLNNYKMDLEQFCNRIKSKNIIKNDFNKELISINLCNKSRLKRLKLSIKDFKNKNLEQKRIVLLLDESDLFNHSIDKIDKYNKVTKYLKLLLKYVDEFVCYTATPHTHTFLQDIYPIRSNNITYIPETEDYVSWSSKKFKVKTIESLYLSQESSKWSKEQVKHFLDIIDKPRHRVLLVNVAINISNHYYIGDLIRRHDTNYTVLIINGGQVKAMTTYEVFTSISSALKYFKNSSKIILITCRQVGRGISIRTDVKDFKTNLQCASKETFIYADAIIYDTSETKTTDAIIQNALRISGRFPMDILNDPKFRLTLYTTKTLKNIIKTQLKWSNNIRANVIEDQKLQRESQIIELIKPLDSKPLRKPFPSSRGKFVIKDIQGKWYTSNTAAVADLENDSATGIYNDFKRWFKESNTTGIAMFIKSIDPYKSYTMDEIVSLVESIGDINPNSFINNSKRPRKGHGNGVLLIADGSKLKFNPDLLTIYEKFKTTTMLS